ncbi:MAG TPA: tetraacyldisaccharide 4'-kinase [Pyrinomonadaceae bacterium]|nr:tetraacyldisaccharide 4'-kinase [Pyrinomonadaceae bacterium]
MKWAATIALAPLSLVYGAAVKIRSALYRNGILKIQSVSVPVISVGNITTGGTGKTPLVEWIAGQLAARGHRVCVLTRGYRRANPSERVVVSDGEQIVADTHQSGDEAMMLARSLVGKASVVCDADRVAGANWAIENLNPDALILDDGFQHVRIGRDLDIVTIDATNPWGDGRLLPAGVLRERVNSLGRADCIIVTRTRGAVDTGVQERIRQATDAPTFRSTTVVRRIRELDSLENAIDKETLRKQPIAAFCGIGNPNAFFQQLRDEGFELRLTEAFRDHHKYCQTEIDRLSREAADAGAQALITTAKDAVKLTSMRFGLPCYVVEIEMQLEEADRLLALVDQAIETRLSELNS